MIYEPISLGYTCEVKYQLSRVLHSRAFPGEPEDSFRRMLLTHERGERSFERYPFDWQITPFAAVLEYLERDFEGVFEREDLTISDDGTEVVHARLKTCHPHEFTAADGPLTEADIDAAYPAARAKFDHLAARFRTHLSRPGPFLYVFREIRIYDEALKLAELLGRHADHRFRLLFVDFDGQNQIMGPVNDAQVLKGWVPWAPDKPAGREWEGDDARWHAILEPFTLGLHGDIRPSRTLEEAEASV